MIGNGTAALASTTALASTGGHARRSAGSDGGFAQTLDQAMKGENPEAAGEGAAKGSETAPATPDVGRTQRDDFFASARWRNVAGEETSLESQEAGADEVVEAQTGADTEIVEAVMSSEGLADEASSENQDALGEAGDSEVGASPSAETTIVNGQLASAAEANGAASSASEENDVPADETPRKTGGSEDVSPAEVQAAATDVGDQPAERKAGETAVASGETGRTRKAVSSDQAGSHATDDATSAPAAAEAAGRSAVQNKGEAVSGMGEFSPARSSSGAPAPSAAPQSNISARPPELKPDAPAKTSGKAEPAVAADSALDRASKSITATTQTNTLPAQASASDKPVQTAPVVQMTQASATTGTTSPAGQVADAVARDLEELAPTRVAVTANGAPGRPIRSMLLQLNPAELGTVNIRLHSVDGQLHVAIRAESDKTAEMLSRDSDAIRSALRAAGISSSEVTVSVNRNDQTPQQFTGQNRDTSGQFAGQDNRGNTSNDSRNPNREGPSGNSTGPLGRGNADSGDADGNDRLFI